MVHAFPSAPRRVPAALAVLLAGGLALAPAGAAWAQAAPAAATAQDMAAATAFLQKLADDVFAILRDRSLGEAEKDRRLRQLLIENVAVKPLGDRLIRRHRASITDAQYKAYSAAFPDFVVGAYGDRLRAYSGAEFKVVRSLPRGTRGDVDIVARVSERTGQPFESIWTVGRNREGRWRLLNLTVAGVNMALTQEADFSAYVERNGFDALIRFMRERGPSAG